MWLAPIINSKKGRKFETLTETRGPNKKLCSLIECPYVPPRSATIPIQGKNFPSSCASQPLRLVASFETISARLYAYPKYTLPLVGSCAADNAVTVVRNNTSAHTVRIQISSKCVKGG